MLRLSGIAKTFGQTQVLRDFDLEARDGELTVLVGPSGCGKTTALRIVAGLEAPDAGSVSIGERDVTRLEPATRDVAMVFQSQALLPHLTVAGNIGFGLSVRHVPRPERERRVREAAELTGCAEQLERRPEELSGGERQRVALARALVREPAAFLLDEPLSSLDAQVRVAMRAEVRELQRRVGVTTLMVTHDQVEALTMGDRVAVMAEGAVRQVGTPEDVYHRPADRTVATFLGSPAMNVLPARVEAGEVVAGPFRIPIPVGRPGVDDAVELGVRPEHVVLGGEGGPGAVVLAEMAGSETFLHLDAGGERVVARASAAAAGSIPVDPMPLRAYLFDADGRTLLAWERP